MHQQINYHHTHNQNIVDIDRLLNELKQVSRRILHEGDHEANGYLIQKLIEGRDNIPMIEEGHPSAYKWN